MKTYTVITLHQPWATFVVKNIKRIETRCWSTNIRGPILIHAAQAHNDIGRALFEGNRVREYAADKDIVLPDLYKNLPFGAIIGQVDIKHVASSNEIMERVRKAANKGIAGLMYQEMIKREAFLGDLSADRFGWFLRNAIEFEHPILAKGSQRFWHYEMKPQSIIV
jgi:hypothetical protein